MRLRKQGRIHGNPCRGRLGRGSNGLGPCIDLKYSYLNFSAFKQLKIAKNGDRTDRQTNRQWLIGRVARDKKIALALRIIWWKPRYLTLLLDRKLLVLYNIRMFLMWWQETQKIWEPLRRIDWLLPSNRKRLYETVLHKTSDDSIYGISTSGW